MSIIISLTFLFIWTLLQFIRVKLYYEIYGFLDDVYYPVYCPHTAFEYFLWPSFFWWVIKFKDLKPLWTLHCLTTPAFSRKSTLSKCRFDLQLFQRFAKFFFDHVQFFVEKKRSLMSTNKAIGLLDNFYEGPQKDHRNVTVKIKCKAKKDCLEEWAFWFF